ncbi:MAG: complex I subunit 1 family protein [Planctomycetota bacterium]
MIADLLSIVLDAIFPIPAQLFVGIVVVLVMIHAILGTIPLLIYFERKISSYIQDRLGPNRTGFDFGLPFLQKLFTPKGAKRPFGFWGLGQSAADGLKFVLKEDFIPKGADRALFTLAPIVAVIPAFIGWAVIPWGGVIELTESISIAGREFVEAGRALVAVGDLNIGFIYLLAVAGIGVYGVILGGWASNNKYSFLGGLRASAGMISYEIPMGTAILAIILVAGSVQPSVIVSEQASAGWFVVSQPIAALLFFVCSLAEANRAPFDNAEAEQELVGGYHTEYSAMRFALFFLAEYAHMITASAFLVALFFGGYHLPFIPHLQPEATGLLAAFLKVQVYFIKVMLVICFMMVIRWTLPRIRYDQVLALAWNTLIPVGIAQVVATSIWVFLGWTQWWALLGMNVLLAVMITALLAPATSVGTRNRKVQLAGSRFSPLPGERVVTGPSDPIALSDAPMQSTTTAH